MKLSIGKRFGLLMLSIMPLTLAVLFSASITAQTASAHSTHAQRPNSGAGAVVYTHIATAANSAGNWTDLNNNASNNHPNAVVIVTPNVSAGVNGIVDKHAAGVWYDGIAHQWAIFNEDGTPIPHGAAFNVYAVPAPFVGTSVEGAITFTVTAANSKGNWADIDNPITNNTANVFLNVTASWRGSIAFDAHPIGVWYDAAANKWAVFNEGGMDAIPVGTTFNILIDTPIVSGVFVHKITSTNTTGNSTTIDNSATNNNSNKLVFATPNYDVVDVLGTYDDHVLGVFYSNGKWSIRNLDGAPMQKTGAFNVLASDPYPAA